MNKMKRILAIGLTLIMLGSFAACGKDKDKDKDPDAEKTSVSTTQTVKLAYNGRLGERVRVVHETHDDDDRHSGSTTHVSSSGDTHGGGGGKF